MLYRRIVSRVNSTGGVEGAVVSDANYATKSTMVFPRRWSPGNRRRTLREGVLVETLTRLTRDGLLIRREHPANGTPSSTMDYLHTRQILIALQPLITWARHNRPFWKRANTTAKPH